MNAPVILNVDDNEPALYARSRVLRQAGFDVFEARSGEAALAQLPEVAPNLVLLDINLPDMPGYEVCRRIKASPIFSSVLVLHISATFAERQHRVLGLERGADGYLTEPVEPAELIATVNAFLRLQAVEEALRESEEKYRTLMESLADGVFVLQDDRFVFANAAFTSMVAEHPEGLFDVPAQRTVAAESLSRWVELCRACMEAGPEPGARHEIRMVGRNEARRCGPRCACAASAMPAGLPCSESCTTSPSGAAWSRSCASAPKPCSSRIGTRTSFSRCSPTSCATRSRPW